MKIEKTTRYLSRSALRLSEGLFSHAVDMTLWFIAYLGTMSMPQRTTGQLWRAQVAADRFINQINYEVIKHAITTAKRQGLVKKSRRHAWPEITSEGKRRLASLVPKYDEQRTWDGRLHMVTYDIPERRRKDRDLLREYLVRIGCGRLQESVWVTPYNPTDILREFIEEKGLEGTIIVSDIGKDGSIGEEDILGLVVRVYNLEELNKRYEEWLQDIEGLGVDHLAVLRYLSILRDDPQLPFALLPLWWKGGEAFKRVRSHLQKLPI